MPRTLLLADASPTIQRVVELIFADEDVEVISVADGEQAIARVQYEKPHIVLADIAAGRRNGYDIAAFIHQDPSLAHIPVLLLAAAFDAVDDARVLATGCAGVVVKPFEPRELIERVLGLIGAGAPGESTKRQSEIPRAFERLMPSRVAPRPASIEWGQGSPADEPPAPPQAPRPLRLVVTPPSQAAPGDEKTEEASSRALEDYFDQLDAAFAARAAVTDTSDTVFDADTPFKPDTAFKADTAFEAGTAFNTDTPSRRDNTFETDRAFAAEDASAAFARMDRSAEAGHDDLDPARPDLMELVDIWDFDSSTGSIPAPIQSPHADRVPVPRVEGTAALPPPVVEAEPPPVARPSTVGNQQSASRADAFTALLAAEQGEPMVDAARIVRAPEQTAIDDALIERTVQRVMERLAPIIREELERLQKTRAPEAPST